MNIATSDRSSQCTSIYIEEAIVRTYLLDEMIINLGLTVVVLLYEDMTYCQS